MQELTIPPQSTAPYTPAGGSNMPSAPRLGTPIPGTTGGLPTQQGLNVASTPLDNSLQSQQPQPQQSAQQVQSYGRGDDTVLVHMTPNELNSLQGLAMAHGGSLTVNPNTGLPEAGFLGKLLPTILGAALAATGVGAPLAAGIVGAGSTAATGSLKKGLMAGLGAFGGASLAGAAGLGSSISNTGFGTLSDKAGIFGANMGAGAGSTLGAGLGGTALQGAPSIADTAAQTARTTLLPSVAPGALAPVGQLAPLPTGIANAASAAGTTAAKTGLAGFAQRFGQTASRGLPAGIASKAAPMLAATGLMQGVSGAMAPSGYTTPTGMVDNSYQGPYTSQIREMVATPTKEELMSQSGERLYFNNSMPEIYNMQGQIVQPGSSTARGTPILQNYLLPTNKKTPKGSPMYGQRFVPYMGAVGEETGYSAGGEVNLKPGGFVVDAHTVSRTGNGYTPAGQEAFAKLGGIPLNGPGDGVSDSIKARIGDQPARVAAGEVYMPPEAVKKAGGAAKLYAMMDRAHRASKRGQDSKLRRGLA